MARAKRKGTEYEYLDGFNGTDLPLYKRLWFGFWKKLYSVMSILTYLGICFGFLILVYFTINSLMAEKYYTSIVLGLFMIYSSVYINKHNPK